MRRSLCLLMIEHRGTKHFTRDLQTILVNLSLYLSITVSLSFLSLSLSPLSVSLSVSLFSLSLIKTLSLNNSLSLFYSLSGFRMQKNFVTLLTAWGCCLWRPDLVLTRFKPLLQLIKMEPGHVHTRTHTHVHTRTHTNTKTCKMCGVWDAPGVQGGGGGHGAL